MTTFVLVHGGWHGGWCWQRVDERLTAAGHRVLRPTLTGLGERRHLASPAIGLETHALDVQGVLENEDVHDAVLVGHSSAGAVLSEVAGRAGSRIGRLVYLDAFVPRPGQSVLDLLAPARRDYFLERADRYGDGWLVPLDWDTAIAGWGVTDPADVEWMRPRLAPQPLGTLRQAVLAAEEPRVPCSFVHCRSGPTVDTFAPFADRAGADPGRWTLHHLDAGHDAMITVPDELTRVLTDIAARA